MLSVRTPTAAASQSFDSAYREIDGLRPLQPLDKIALSVVTGTATPFPATPFPAENVHAAAIHADVIVDQLYALALQVLRQPINHNPNLIAALTMSTLTTHVTLPTHLHIRSHKHPHPNSISNLLCIQEVCVEMWPLLSSSAVSLVSINHA